MDSFTISNSISKLSQLETWHPRTDDGQDIISSERISCGERLLECYTVESEALHGGMGSVWRVRYDTLDKALAMKRPKPRFFAEAGKETKARFIHECEAWIGLGLHPNIVACYYVRDIGGVPTIFAEWMEGGSLEKRIRDRSLYDGDSQAQQARALRIALDFARGLHYAHDKGLVHQDVKPDNVLLTADMRARVSDFGLSGAYGVLAGTNSAIAGSGAYTPAYCSPEQARREPLSIRTDIYSWAVSVMEIYTEGCRWKDGREAGERCAEFLSDCRLVPPRRLSALLERCMRGDEAGRPEGFAEVEEELKAIYRETLGADCDESEGVAASDSTDSLNNQAVSYMELGMDESAVSCWDEAGNIDPTHVESIYNRGLIAWRTGAKTGLELWRQLMSHPFFMRTEAGRQAVDALAREAGKTDMNAPLFTDEPERECYSIVGLWRGRVYAFENDNDAWSLKVLDAETGELIERIDLSDAVRAAEGKISSAFLSEDCAQAGLATREDRVVVYDIASRKVLRNVQLIETGMYDSAINYMLFGKDSRFLRRMVSHGLGHAAPTPETYDLYTGERVRQGIVSYADWQMINAGAKDPLGKPNGKDYYNSLCDGLRAVPVFERDGRLMSCDQAGNPVAALPRALARELPRIRREMPGEGIRRIADDGTVWFEGSEGLMQFDLASGKCLRSYDIPGRIFMWMCVDEHGEGVIWRRTRGRDENPVWKYRRLPPVRGEDRADWLISTLESYEEYRDRIRKLEALRRDFGRALADGDRERMCRIYDEASGIRRFLGSENQQMMADGLNATCRQRNSYMLLLSNGELTPDMREDILAPFGLDGAKERIKPPAVSESPLTVCWEGGFYVFGDEAEKRAFTRQFVDKYTVLDADERHGLIAVISIRQKGGTDYNFKVWSVDERRFLLDYPMSGFFSDGWLVARFGRKEEAGTQMLLAVSGVESHPNLRNPPFQIYQFSCDYAPDPMRRAPWKDPRDGRGPAGSEGTGKSRVEKLNEVYRDCAKKAAVCPLDSACRRKREDTAHDLKLALQRMGMAFDAEGLSGLYEEYRALAESRPTLEGYAPLMDFAQSQYAYALSHSSVMENSLRAMALYDDLAKRHPEDKQHRMNADALAGRLNEEFSRYAKRDDAKGLGTWVEACEAFVKNGSGSATVEQVYKTVRSLYAYTLTRQVKVEDKLRALFLYDALAEQYPREELYRKNVNILSKQLASDIGRLALSADGMRPLYEICLEWERSGSLGKAAEQVCAAVQSQYAFALNRPGLDDVESSLHALDLYDDLAERYPEREQYLKDVENLTPRLIRRFERAAAKLDLEKMEALHENCAARLAAHPHRESAVKLFDSAETQLAFVLSRREDIASKERALEMYERLSKRHPEETTFAKNTGILQGQLFRLRREQKKQERRQARAEGRGGLFSFFRRK